MPKHNTPVLGNLSRTAALLAIALAAAWCVYANSFSDRTQGQWGFQIVPPMWHVADVRAGRVVRIIPGSPADKAGIARGDLVRALVSRGSAIIYPVAGQRVTLLVTNAETQRTVTLTAAPQRVPRYPSDIVLYACELIGLALALMLTVRRWNDSAARALTLYFICQSATLASSFVSPTLYGAIRPFQLGLIFLGYAGLIRFTAIYPEQSQTPRFRQLFARWAPAASAALAALWFFNGAAQVWLTFTWWAYPLYRYSELACANVLPFIGLISGFSVGTQAERKRIGILIAIFLASISGPIAYNLVLMQHPTGALLQRPLLATLIIMNVGCVYVILRHRLFDLGFVLNRAAIYAVLTSILVPAFALFEWLAERYVSSQNRSENVLIQVGIVLTLFLSVRWLHERAERFVDTVLFRKRHENEAALRAFARHVLFMTDTQAVADQAVRLVCLRTDASWVALYDAFDGSHGTYRPRAYTGDRVPPAAVSENDLAVAAMQGDRAAVDHMPDSLLHDAIALPFFAHGKLSGFVACGGKNSGETYAPDELDALGEVARSIGVAFDGLRIGALEKEIAALRALVAASTAPGSRSAVG